MESLNGKVAFITGGASGIGLGMGRAFAERGAKLILADIEAAALDRAKAELEAAGHTVATMEVDVTDRAAMQQAARDAVEIFGQVNVLCNNAGVNAAGPVAELGFDDWDWVMGVNLNGVINGVVCFLPELTRHGSDAHIVNTASVGGLVGMRDLAPYNTSKFAVVGLSEALRAGLDEHGTGVSVLCPGVVNTNLPDAARNRPAELGGQTQPQAPQPPPDDAPPPAAPLRVLEIDEVGNMVADAVLSNAFYICTHPEFFDVVRQRNAAVEAALDGEADPDIRAATSGMVRPF